MMKNTQPLDFNKHEKKKRASLKVISLAVAVVLAGALSFLALLYINDFDLDRFFGTRSPGEKTTDPAPEETTVRVEPAAPFTDEQAMNFLLICSDSEKIIDFCDIISVSYAENVIRVKPVSPELTLDYKKMPYTLSQLFALSSCGAVRDALTDRGMKISRYISVNETNFKMIMQKLGPVEILLKNELRYSVDAITYSFPAGKQSMAADTLLKYMKFAAEGDELLAVQAEALAQVLRTHFTAENNDRGEDFFSSLINLVDSDISAFDYTDNRYALSEFLKGKPPVKVIN